MPIAILSLASPQPLPYSLPHASSNQRPYLALGHPRLGNRYGAGVGRDRVRLGANAFLGACLGLAFSVLILCGCSSVSSVGLSGGATSQGDYSGTVQIYFRDAAGQIVTARVPRSSLPTTNAWPVTSDLDVPAGQTLPVIP